MQGFDRDEMQSQIMQRNAEDGVRATGEQKSTYTDLPPIQRTKPPSVYFMNYQNSKQASNMISSEAGVIMSRSHNDRSKTMNCNDQEYFPNVTLINNNQRYSYVEPKSAELPVLRNNANSQPKAGNASNCE